MVNCNPLKLLIRPYLRIQVSVYNIAKRKKSAVRKILLKIVIKRLSF